ncbi:MAG: DsbA family protein [Pseudomonadota bacterium]
MIRTWVISGALSVGMAASTAGALDLDAMSLEERDAFGAAVREYLLENPEVLMEAIAVLEARQEEEQAAADIALVAAHAGALYDDGHSVVSGNPDGDITIIEFIDYRCSFCRRAHPEVSALMASDGNIRKITKEFPILGPESVEASRFAIAVLQLEGEEAYLEMNDTLIEHRGTYGRDALARVARSAGLDAEAVIAHMDDPQVDDVIRANRQLGEALAITGTPTFVFGDQLVRGYVPLDGMRAIVADLRDE